MPDDSKRQEFSRADWMIEDSDLAPLRGDPEFQKILAAARENQERRRLTPRAVAR